MIERKFVEQNIQEYLIGKSIVEKVGNAAFAGARVLKTPLGEKIIIQSSRPGMIVGRKGENIKSLTDTLKRKFKLENPQIEIEEVADPNINAKIVAERIASTMEKLGSQRFKAIGHRVMADAMNSKALGIEIIISGKIPSARAKSWRFYSGYLKKCGDIALTGVDTAYSRAELKSGTVGIIVRIMPPTTVLPDRVHLREDIETVVEAIPQEKSIAAAAEKHIEEIAAEIAKPEPTQQAEKPQDDVKDDTKDEVVSTEEKNEEAEDEE